MTVFLFSFDKGILFDWALIIYGTTADPLQNNPHVPTATTPTAASTTSSKESTSDKSDASTSISGK